MTEQDGTVYVPVIRPEGPGGDLIPILDVEDLPA